MNIAIVILAAGQGVRMKSSLPKVLHPLAGKPLIRHVLETARQLTDQPPVVVIGHGGDQVQAVVGNDGTCVRQEQQLGTAHAVMTARSLLAGTADLVLVMNSDMPLLTARTLQSLMRAQAENRGPISMRTLLSADSRGFGRVVRDGRGMVQAIIEEAHATPEQLAIRELNAGVYCFRAEWLWQALERIPLSPKGEYYLTDTVGLAAEEGLPIEVSIVDDPAEALGINTRVHLAEAETHLRQRINRRWMLAGVTILDPATTYIEADVTIGADTVLYPNTHLRGNTTIGSHCRIGPNSILEDTRVGDHCLVLASVTEGAILEEGVSMGPYGHLRKGAHLGAGVHMGNFGEVKSSYLGPNTKMGHFSYIGDAQIGANVNIGAGTITCNFDGEHKHPTEIGDDVFIGSDTMLVAPLKIGDRARTGAGSVVTHDVPADTIVVGVPARPHRKHNPSE